MDPVDSILVVDDDPTQIAILTAYFSSMQVAEILHARDGAHALEILDRHPKPVGLIVSDLKMPNMDGYELIRLLKSRGFKGRIALFSGHQKELIENAANLARMYGLDVIGHISKPLTKSSLDKVFGSRKSSEAGRANADGTWPLKEDVSAALDKGLFVPFYQPKVDLLTGSISGAEALVRWIDPERGVVSPGLFLPIATNSGLMGRLTIAIVECVIEDMQRPEWAGMKIAINIPPGMLSDITLPDIFMNRIGKVGLKTSQFCLEITESTVLDLDPATLEVLSRLRIHGFEISIDDFGTGASNISNLRMFPFNELKIDQSFINNVLTDAFSAETVNASVSLARMMNMRVVAEGIERKEVFDYVKAKGVHQAQGYLIAKPMPADQITEYFSHPHSWMRSIAAA